MQRNAGTGSAAFIENASLQQHPRQSFTSGRELIEAVKARREEATAYWKIAKELEGEIADMDAYDAERIDGVKVLWLIEGQRAARDETAFRHALRSAHKLRAAGNRMTDAAIIDAYEHAYTVAQQVGADGRVAEMPPMRDRQTMTRRVRGYVLAGNKDGGIENKWRGWLRDGDFP